MMLNKHLKFVLFFCCAMVLASIIYYYYGKLLNREQRTFIGEINLNVKNLVSKNIDDQYMLRTDGCLIEKLDPWDPSLKEYFAKEKPYTCPQEPKYYLVEQTEDGYLRINNTVMNALSAEYKSKNIMINISRPYICQKRNILFLNWRNYRISENFTEFMTETPMNQENAEIKCFIGDTMIYQDYFFKVVRKPQVEAECLANNKDFLAKHRFCKSRSQQLSVLIIGIDSLSKANMLRYLPKTFNFLVNKLSAIDMLGYNKVGLNTHPCLIPYLTGNSSEELDKTGWDFFYNCTIIHQLFAKAGYRTAFVENMDYAGKLSCERQLAHYYGHIVYAPAEANSIKEGCWRGKPDDARLADWAFEFQSEFANDLHYGHFWFSIFSHSDLNNAQQLDPIIFKLFYKIHSQNLLNNTLVIFMSDHGVRYGSFRENEKGRLEENLPFIMFLFPQWFREMHSTAMDTLEKNRHRLITAFDLHETLKSIRNCEYPQTVSQPQKHRGISLFQPISGNRTCDDAAIPIIYCACKEQVIDKNPNSEIANEFAQLVVNKLNKLTERERRLCVKYQLEKVLWFKKINRNTVDPNKPHRDVFNNYIIFVLVNPGEAKFEATIQYIASTDSNIINDDIRRINRYGDTSHCIKHNAFLKSICFCKQQLSQ